MLFNVKWVQTSVLGSFPETSLSCAITSHCSSSSDSQSFLLFAVNFRDPHFWCASAWCSAMVADSKSKSDISFPGIFASSAFAACFAEVCTIPLDTAKVRLQLQKQSALGDTLTLPKYNGMLGTVSTIAREEGLSALWKGIVPGLHRQCLYGGLRIGLYEPVKTFYVGSDFVGDVPLSKKILAALTTGAVAIAVANPTDLVKVRLQAEGKLPPGVPRRYSGSLNAYSTIVRQPCRDPKPNACQC